MTERLINQTATVLLFSNRADVREQMRLAVGEHPAEDLTIRFVEVSGYAETIALLDAGDVDLVLLDGEAQPGGGMGIARQLKDEYDPAPLAVVTIARAADRWLAAYSRADATVMYPLDPMTTGETIAGMLRTRSAAPVGTR